MKKVFFYLLLILISSLLFSCSKNVMVEKLEGYAKNLDGTYATAKQLKAKYYFIYYGASWCPHCVGMRSEIADFYNTYKKNNNFIFIFAGCEKDKSNDDLTSYLEKEKYPFCFIDYDKRDECGFFKIDEYTKCEKFYIPGFILFDDKGMPLSNSNGPLKSDYKASRPFEYFKTNIVKDGASKS